ncbi:amidohydrolase [candidate division CSSED10-310 bacterium]|uniref:Amidohydrolase n=1 Tax=candidate division CSSED10-310 bacterium TaxID=2855610 RepID=A0ABV6YZ44_UNCC1
MADRISNSGPTSPQKRSFVLTSDSIFDGHTFRPDITHIAVTGGEIVALGNHEVGRVFPRNAADILDFKGRTILPGFIDGHCHFMQMGLASLHLDLAPAASREEFFVLISQQLADNRAGGPIIGEDWDESAWSDHRFPTRKELDSISAEIPIIARRVCGHLAVVNTPALAYIPRALFKGDYGHGIVVEEAILSLDDLLTHDPDSYRSALRYAQALAFKNGVTTIHEIVSNRFFAVYQHFLAQKELQIRVVAYLPVKALHHYGQTGLVGGFGNDRLQFGGVKIFTDGSLGARTAALSNPYHDDPPNRGLLLYSLSRLSNFITRSEQARIPVMIHAIGDRAIAQALKAFEKSSYKPGSGLRHRLEHLEVLDAPLISKINDLGLTASLQPNFAHRWSQPGGMNWQRLGPERIKWCNPYSHIISSGGNVAFGSDCMPFGPLYGLEGACNHPIPELGIPLEKALETYTAGSAYAAAVDAWTGSLAPGKKADIVVLDHDISRSRTLADVAVNATFLNGDLVYSNY